MIDLKNELLFVGHGTSAVCWYRIVLPATALGCDYVGVFGEPPKARYATGIARGESHLPNFADYKAVVLQQPRGLGWLKVIRELQSRGTIVIYEVDDWLHSIKSQKDHDFRKDFDRRALLEYEMCMKAADAMIVSTEFIAKVYARLNKRIFVCENGVDITRYDLELPLRRSVNIGWAGATGHTNAILPWLKGVAEIMQRKSYVNFVSIGEPFARGFHEHFPRDRALAVPFAALEQYPAAMTLMDIALAPAGHTGFYRGKSDLRWLEAGALGIPIVAHPLVYPKIRHGVDGFHAATPQEATKILDKLVDEPFTRKHVGQNARRYVREERSSQVVSQRWAEVIQTLWSEREVARAATVAPG